MKPITIIGGGLAGLTLGILLRRENIPVAVIEAGKYPRHRVCGEFLSGRGREILSRLGLDQRLPEFVEASSCSFHLAGRRPVRFELNTPALCISRYELDAFFVEEFRREGGVLKIAERVETGSLEEGFVRATGRRRALNAGGRLFGLKAHATGTHSGTDLEMHFGPHRYVGVCRLPGGRSNVCGLFYSGKPMRSIHDEWKTILESSVFSSALTGSNWDDASFSSVAAITLERDNPAEFFAIGDAAAMTPPLTGNGMSMAMESATIAFPFLTSFSAGKSDWATAVAQHARAWRGNFWARLRWASFLQRMTFARGGQRILFLGVKTFPSLPRLFFTRTR